MRLKIGIWGRSRWFRGGNVLQDAGLASHVQGAANASPESTPLNRSNTDVVASYSLALLQRVGVPTHVH
jgi:hypothetical protein